MNNRMQSVTLIGPGRLGMALLDALDDCGYEILSVVTRTGKVPVRVNPKTTNAAALEARLNSGPQILRVEDMQDDNTGQLIFITTPDDAISETAEKLSSSAVGWQGRVIAHVSGFLNSGELAPLRERGASVGSFQPLQTFTDGSGREEFEGIHVTLEGDEPALNSLREAAENLGAVPHTITREQKHFLHVAAVFLSNYLVSLAGISERLIQSSIPGADLSWLRPLLSRTTSNLLIKTPEEALSGPLSRGDRQTVENHLHLLEGEPEWKDLYRLLGLQALELVRSKGSLSTDSLQELQSLLREE